MTEATATEIARAFGLSRESVESRADALEVPCEVCGERLASHRTPTGWDLCARCSDPAPDLARADEASARLLHVQAKLGALDHLGRGADDVSLANLAALYLAQMVVRLEAATQKSVRAPWEEK